MSNDYELIEFEDFGEENEDDLSITNLELFNNAVIWGTDWTAETVVNQLEKGTIDLDPKFQRRDAWDRVRKSRLIESLMLGLPVPPIILAEKKDKKNSFIVIDGKQRLLTVRQFCADQDEKFEQLKLTGLQYLTKLNGKSYKDIVNSNEFDNYSTAFENQTIRTVVIKNWPNEEFLFTVFLRLNTGSKKLSPQELRQALHPGCFLDYIDEAASKSVQILKMLKIEKPDTRMRDVELAIRYFAFKYFVETYNGNLKDFLDNTCKSLNEEWSSNSSKIIGDFNNLEMAIDTTFKIFGEDEAFCKLTDSGKNNKRFNRAVYEIMVYYFSFEEVRNHATPVKDALTRRFKELCVIDRDFRNSLESTTKDLHKTIYRFEKWQEVLSSETGLRIPKFTLQNGRIAII